MNQQPPWPPQEPRKGQQLYGQQEWKQHLPPHQLSLYNHLSQATPGQFQRLPNNYFPPLRRQSGIWQWYKSRTKKGKLSIGCGAILAVLLFFSCIGTAVGSVNLATQSTPSPTPPSNQAAILTSPTVPPLPTSTLSPTPPSTPTPQPAIAPTYVPQPTPTDTLIPTPTDTPTPCPGVNCNPWGYNFSPGNFIYSPPSAFCHYFSCSNNFPHGHGYVVECKDGEYSKSGGIQSACSDHGGVMRPLYSH
jgi:hypothetical protein